MPILKDLTGQRFGSWLVVRISTTDRRKWLCRCDCGICKEVNGSSLTRRMSQSCGCVGKEITRKARLLDITNQKHGFLTPIKRIETEEGYSSGFWLCQCDCGNEVRVALSHLRSGDTKSCGCYRKTGDYIEDTLGRRTSPGRFKPKHGMTGTRVYKAWCEMIRRCCDPGRQNYYLYGGRGITVCERWQNSFENFYTDMGECPEGMSLDRIDPNGLYEPANVRWATQREQQNNKRTSVRYTYQGKTLTIAEWARESKMEMRTLWARLDRGWSIEEALTKPIRGK